ncbi:MAG TPA: hypothetical protein VJ551_00540, partial [Nitrososphaeraceae archaeon]|nr:hypothetical protein [Nitrososphaeraceae archaeon]
MVILKQNYNTVFGALFAFLFLFSILVPQNGSASTLFEEGGSPAADGTEEASTSNIEICDNLVDDDNDGLVDNQDAVDCPTTPGLVPTPTPAPEDEEEAAAPEDEEEAAAPEDE